MKQQMKIAAWQRRKLRVRKKVSGTQERPRMTVYRSNKHIYVQVVDDTTGRTLTSASCLSPEIREELKGLKKIEVAKRVGALAAKRCVEAHIAKVVFDRNGYGYTGRVAAVAQAARDGGLEF